MKKEILIGGLAGLLALNVGCVKKQVSQERDNLGIYPPSRAYFTSTQSDPDEHIKNAEFYPLEKHSFIDDKGIKRNSWFVQPVGNMNLLHTSFGEYGLYESVIDTNLIEPIENLEEKLDFMPNFDFVLKNPMKMKKAKKNSQYTMLFKTEIQSDIDRSSGEVIWRYDICGNKQFKNLWQEPDFGGIGGIDFEVDNVVSFTGKNIPREARIIGEIAEFEDPESDNYQIRIIANSPILRLRQPGSTNVLYEIRPYSLNPKEQKYESLKNIRELRKNDKKD